MVLWLCSDSSRFITGQNILADGGYAIPGHRPWLLLAEQQLASGTKRFTKE